MYEIYIISLSLLCFSFSFSSFLFVVRKSLKLHNVIYGWPLPKPKIFVLLFCRKVPKEFHLDYDKLEDRPSLPTNLSGGSGGPAGSVSGHPMQGGPPSASSSPAPPGISGPPQGSQHSPIMSGSGPSSAGPL